ncbi:MAG TPA: FG-GAP-like repeat-containing protein, partial [Gemmatimonadaceae bacterium]|nr:FG-GAP-like repeat-containing protein [Gemmatimonadaceae bacterium]
MLVVVAAPSCRGDRGANDQSKADELFSARSLGLGFLQKDQLPEAEEQFKKVIDLAPREPLGYANLGLTYLRAGRLDDAQKQLEKAHDMDPRDPEVGLMLAKLYDLKDRRDDARRTLQSLTGAPNARVQFALADLDSRDTSAAGLTRHERQLGVAAAAAPANLAIRLKLADANIRAAHADSAVRQLEEIRRMPPEPPKEARAPLDTTIQLLRMNSLAEARAAFERFRRAMELTKPYQAAFEEVRWLEGPIPGRPVLSFNPRTLITMRGVRGTGGSAGGSAAPVHFVDVTGDVGLPDASSAAGTVAVGDYDGDGTDDVFISTLPAGLQGAASKLFHGQGGQYLDATTRAGVALPPAQFATFTDVDNDGWLDLFLIGTDGRARLYRNTGANAKLEDVTARAKIADLAGATSALLADLDHDGDLDLMLIGGQRQLVYRNNLDGTFTEASAQMGLAGVGPRAAAFGDVDGDGRVDVITAGASGISVFHNGGSLRFADSSAAAGFRPANVATGSTPVDTAAAIAVGDYDNDGALDLVYAHTNIGALWRNAGRGSFRSQESITPLRFVTSRASALFDYDNDGWMDILVVGEPTAATTGVVLLRNDGKGQFL